MANHHSQIAHLVEQTRAQNTDTNKSVDTNTREKQIKFLADKLSGKDQESRTNAVTHLLRLSDSEVTRSQVEKAMSKPSASQQLVELADLEMRDH